MKIVSPFKPFAPESHAHLELGPFDWQAALRMLSVSAARSCGLEVLAITDLETALSVPALHYPTTETRLMLWILDVIVRYLESDDFDQDTIMVSPDTLVFGNIRPYVVGDLTILIRSQPHFADRPILNAIQWWRAKSRRRLVALYKEALALARTLPEDLLTWGADTEPLRQLLGPIEPGLAARRGMKIWMLESSLVMQSLSSKAIAQLDAGEPVGWPTRPILDLKYLRKKYLSRYFDATFGRTSA